MRVGILGGGQLARMLALAGHPLGLEFVVLDPSADACAASLAEQIVADFDDRAALDQLAARCDRITLDFENVPAATVGYLSATRPMRPGPALLAVAQDRRAEKATAAELDIPCGGWAAVDHESDLSLACEQVGLPSILKTCRLGYDGKGQARIDHVEQLGPAFAALGRVPCVLEALIPFSRELSLISTRANDGAIVHYPLSQNVHHDGVLRASLAPAPNITALQPLAEAYGRAIAERFAYVGTFAIEFFQVGDTLLFNEIAPRVHNSGHWSIEGSVCSQFENHLRALMDLPLGPTRLRDTALMLNWIGELPELSRYAHIADMHWHDYNKPVRPGRKLGHATLLGSPDSLRAALSKLVPQSDGEAAALHAARQLLQLP